MKIKIIVAILVLISSFFGNTVETLAPNENDFEASSYSQSVDVESVIYTE